MSDGFYFTIINLIILAINLGVSFLTLKLYTEYFKDKSINAARGKGPKVE